MDYIRKSFLNQPLKMNQLSNDVLFHILHMLSPNDALSFSTLSRDIRQEFRTQYQHEAWKRPTLEYDYDIPHILEGLHLQWSFSEIHIEIQDLDMVDWNDCEDYISIKKSSSKKQLLRLLKKSMEQQIPVIIHNVTVENFDDMKIWSQIANTFSNVTFSSWKISCIGSWSRAFTLTDFPRNPKQIGYLYFNLVSFYDHPIDEEFESKRFEIYDNYFLQYPYPLDHLPWNKICDQPFIVRTQNELERMWSEKWVYAEVTWDLKNVSCIGHIPNGVRVLSFGSKPVVPITMNDVPSSIVGIYIHALGLYDFK